MVKSVTSYFLIKNGKGTHMNVSGATLAKYAPNKNNGLALLKFLSSDIGQELYSGKNSEYPVSKKIKGSSLLESWGKFKQDDSDLNEIAENRKAALIITIRSDTIFRYRIVKNLLYQTIFVSDKFWSLSSAVCARF